MNFEVQRNFSIIQIHTLAVDARKCYASGRGIQPKGVRVRDNADFKVHTEGAGVGELKVRILFLTLCQQLAFRLIGFVYFFLDLITLQG